LLRLKESARQPSPASAIGFLISTRLLHSMWRDGLKCGGVTLCIRRQGIALAVESL
jgi:hypothetical protein